MSSSEETLTLPAATGTLSVTTQEHGAVLVVGIRDGRLEARNAFACKSFLRERIAAGATRVVVDLAAVTFIDSSGLGALVAAMKALQPSGTFALAAPGPAVKAMLELTRTASVFTIFDTAEAAVRSLA